MRKFKLINARGEEFDLMRKDAFFSSPAGLGIAKDYDFMRTGSAFSPTELFNSQKNVNGEIVFKSYEIYKEFTLFVAYTPLKLAYMPLNEWAYLDGYITGLEKTEITVKEQRLICPMEFIGTSMWYILRGAKRTSQPAINAKLYNYQYDYEYADELNGVLRILNNSSEDAPATISIFGPIEDPTWTLAVNNKTTMSGAMSGTIADGNKLVIVSRDGELEIAEYVVSTNTFVANRYQDCDFSRENFIYAPPGQSTLIIGGIGSVINAWVEVTEIHETI